MSTAPNPSQHRRRFSWPLAITIIVVTALLLATTVVIYLTRTAKSAALQTVEVARQGLTALKDIASAFRSGEIATSFSSYTTQIEGSSRFQFATIDQLELFERSDSQTAFWGQLELPRVVVEARAPVEYSYFLDLNGAWHFVLEDSRLTVLAPPIEHNRPAFNPSKIDYRVQEESLWRDEQPVLDALRNGMGAMAEERANKNVELVRELGRRRTQEFVERWLLANFGTDSSEVRVDVVFADEDAPVFSDTALQTSTVDLSGAATLERPERQP